MRTMQPSIREAWGIQAALRQGVGKLIATGVLLTAGLVSMQTHAQTLPHQSKYETVGTVNCTSSTCHGSIKERSATPVLQNEYTTWQRQDAHTRAYDVLLNDQSRRIAKNLGLNKPAHETQACLVCHSHNVPEPKQGARFDHTEGIGCEGCHGPAEEWIKTHVEPKPSHGRNIDHGLYPTNEPYALAKLCVSCHMGDASRPITHEIMGAGHPRLSIELDTFLALQPPHYKIDEDWRERKGSYDSAKVWAMGQVVASQNLVDLIADPKRSRQGVMPEFMMYDCHACHAPMSKLDWQTGMAAAPGMPRLNDSSLIMVAAIVKAVMPGQQAEFEKRLTALHSSSTSLKASFETLQADAKSMRTLLGSIQIGIMGANFDGPAMKKVFSELVKMAAGGQYTDYAKAEQAYMSLSSVASSLTQKGEGVMADQINPSLRRMLTILRNEDQYDRERFQSEIRGLQQIVGVL